MFKRHKNVKDSRLKHLESGIKITLQMRGSDKAFLNLSRAQADEIFHSKVPNVTSRLKTEANLMPQWGVT